MRIDGYKSMEEIRTETADIIKDVFKSEFKTLPAAKIHATAAKCKRTNLYTSIASEEEFKQKYGTAMGVFKVMVKMIKEAPGYFHRIASIILLLPVIDDILTEENENE